MGGRRIEEYSPILYISDNSLTHFRIYRFLNWVSLFIFDIILFSKLVLNEGWFLQEEEELEEISEKAEFLSGLSLSF